MNFLGSMDEEGDGGIGSFSKSNRCKQKIEEEKWKTGQKKGKRPTRISRGKETRRDVKL